MPLDLELLRRTRFPEREFAWDERDTILYALGIGLGSRPEDLRFVYEKDLHALPTLATVIAWDDRWQEAIGLDVSKIVHGEMRLALHRPLPPRGRVRSRFDIPQVIDKGPGRGAVLLARTELRDAADGSPLATLLSTVFARGDGGFGGPRDPGPVPHPIPSRAPDTVLRIPTLAMQAALYRLSGDRNPLHIDPAFALEAGFDRPILHGLCTWGMVAARFVQSLGEGDPARLRHFEARFTAPAYPGETLVAEVWSDGGTHSFRVRVEERGLLVLDHGKAILTPPAA